MIDCPKRTLARCVLSVLATTAVLAASARAEMTAEELAKAVQNPVANLISVPFQNNTNLTTGRATAPRTS